MIIEVTQGDIDSGIPKLIYACPIAYAFARKGIRATIGPNYAYWGNKFVYFPKEVVGFIYDFDNHLPVKPFSFEVNVP